MSSTTDNLGLVKPAQNDYYDVDVFNGNADKIDSAIGNIQEQSDLRYENIVQALDGKATITENLQSSGYVILGDTVLQWGEAATESVQTTIIFPLEFGELYSVQITSVIKNNKPYITSKSNTFCSIAIDINESAGSSVSWLAIGKRKETI